MELKEFVKNVLKDLVDAIEEVREESTRDMRLASHKSSNQTVEFDIAITAEDSIGTSGKAGIKVFQFIEGGGEMSKDVKNSTVSRVSFGVHIDTATKVEEAKMERDLEQSRLNYKSYNA